MELTRIDPEGVPVLPNGGYSNALLVDGASRLLFVSGQIPQTPTGEVPTDIESQCRLAWAHVFAALMAASMEVSNLVKVTTFLSDRVHSRINTAVRNEVLGDHRHALTVIIADIFLPAWLVEIEAIAAA
ncbi:MAG: RidA family protein [Pseudonocardiales bacterium]|nr:MAG: RidA family protein [Pseudonocardiales bacterium]